MWRVCKCVLCVMCVGVFVFEYVGFGMCCVLLFACVLLVCVFCDIFVVYFFICLCI